jgi:hypothetical protein
MNQVRLTYTPIGGSSTDLDIDVIAVHGAAEPDALELFPGIKHAFLDGSLSEQIAGARRNIEIDFGPKVSAANRRNLVNFWLSASKTLTCLCATPGGFSIIMLGDQGSLDASIVYYYKITAIDAIGESIASTEQTATTNTTDKAARLSWTAVANARCYKIYRKRSTGSYKLLDYTTGTLYNDMGTASESGLVVATPPAGSSTISVVNGAGQFSVAWLGDTELGRDVKMPLVESSIFQSFPV